VASIPAGLREVEHVRKEAVALQAKISQFDSKLAAVRRRRRRRWRFCAAVHQSARALPLM